MEKHHKEVYDKLWGKISDEELRKAIGDLKLMDSLVYPHHLKDEGHYFWEFPFFSLYHFKLEEVNYRLEDFTERKLYKEAKLLTGCYMNSLPLELVTDEMIEPLRKAVMVNHLHCMETINNIYYILFLYTLLFWHL